MAMSFTGDGRRLGRGRFAIVEAVGITLRLES